MNGGHGNVESISLSVGRQSGRAQEQRCETFRLDSNSENRERLNEAETLLRHVWIAAGDLPDNDF